MLQRLEKLRAGFSQLQIEGILIQKPEDRFYFSGFTGSAGMLLITMTEAYLLTDFRYAEQAHEEVKGFKVLEYKHPVLDFLNEILDELKITKVGFEDEVLTYSQYRNYQEKLISVDFVPLKDALAKLRQVKNDQEIQLLQKAIDLSDKAFSHILDFLKPGVSEQDVALELEFFMRKNGATKKAFDIIVASGIRSSMPHGVASEKKLEVGDFITMDLGAVYKGYHSDITRTVIMGEASDKQKDL